MSMVNNVRMDILYSSLFRTKISMGAKITRLLTYQTKAALPAIKMAKEAMKDGTLNTALKIPRTDRRADQRPWPREKSRQRRFGPLLPQSRPQWQPQLRR